MQSKMALYGCDCYAYGLLALGFADLVVEATMQPYDYLALVPVVQGAGGIISDWQVNSSPLLVPCMTACTCSAAACTRRQS